MNDLSLLRQVIVDRLREAELVACLEDDGLIIVSQIENPAWPKAIFTINVRLNGIEIWTTLLANQLRSDSISTLWIAGQGPWKRTVNVRYDEVEDPVSRAIDIVRKGLKV